MPCIDCGLAENADGTGRVDVDLDGGLDCSGVAGGPNNTAGSGLGIKASPVDGNGVVVGAAGLYVRQSSPFEYYGDATGSGVLVGSITGPEASVALTNTTDLAKLYVWQASVDVEFEDFVPATVGLVCQAQVGGGNWFAVSGGQFPAGSWHSPLIGRAQGLALGPGDSITLKARLYVDNGTIDSSSANMIVWGGIA